MMTVRRFAAVALALLASCADAPPEPAMNGAAPGEFVLHARSRKDGNPAEETLRWDAKMTAVIICDMWDDHN